MSWHEKDTKNENLVNFIAGLLGGFISVTLCNPLDIARTRLNVLVTPILPSDRSKPSRKSKQVYPLLPCH